MFHNSHVHNKHCNSKQTNDAVTVEMDFFLIKVCGKPRNVGSIHSYHQISTKNQMKTFS